MNKTAPENIYVQLLQSVKAENPEISSELRLKLRKKLEKAASEKRRPSGHFRMVLAVAASVLVVITSIILVSYDSNDNSVQRKLVNESTVKSGKPVTIKLKYDAKDYFKNVKFSIDLDEGIAFFTKDSEIRSMRSHSWEGSLQKGENVIPFVVNTSRKGKMKIITKAEYNDFSFENEIILDAGESLITVSMFSLDTVAIR